MREVRRMGIGKVDERRKGGVPLSYNLSLIHIFIWQKTFIERGVFRQYGETTARILKDLLDTKAQPLDYAEPCGSVRENFYRMETRNIKEKLDNAGIATRVVFFTKEEKVAYMKMKN